MIGLDTNMIVRYLTQDDAVQSAKATELFERGSPNRNLLS
jgi:predicted nucleic-acid-binding protein